GGVKANMLASNCELKFGFRPLPGQDSKMLLKELAGLVAESSSPSIKAGFFGPCLPAANRDFDQAIAQAKAFSSSLGIKSGDAVNFWTEASLFSQAGLTAFVFGPGDIAQAHTANEWVAIEQLQEVEKTYINILNN
ncbi:MAG: M20/M25/M40 family metallo-hydrolase, partial [Kangiellaceae bacterium]|nr:M20/M25/M40 family metallo-hydrolase [Kangiellaceae bacterium]